MSKENRVSDERLADIAAAIKADCSHGSRIWRLADDIETILLEQALRSKPVAGVEVKPLEWGSKHEDATGYLSYDAKSVLGTYSIYRIKNGGVWSCERGVVNIGQFSSETEAKAAAEADYRQRILSTLSLPAQVPVSFEGLPKRKLDDLVGRGWQVVGYALQNGEQRYGFITTGGFVGWWLPEDYPLHTSGEPPQPEAVITEEMVGRARKRVDEVLDEHGTMSFVQAHGWIGLRKVVSEALTAALKEA